MKINIKQEGLSLSWHGNTIEIIGNEPMSITVGNKQAERPVVSMERDLRICFDGQDFYSFLLLAGFRQPEYDKHFGTIVAVVDYAGYGEDIERLGQCLGYALKQEVRAGELADCYQYGERVFIWEYDSRATVSSAPDITKAFNLAREYWENGTPLRSTNNAGPNTINTRLVKGTGRRDVTWYVRSY
jgi:hypothetical protein